MRIRRRSRISTASGRTFLTIADNGKDASGAEQLYSTRTVLDIVGNQREVIDALGRVVMRYDYDLLKAKIHQASMEAGERWTLNDATGKPIRGWNSRNYVFRTEYDALHRPLKSYVQGGDPSELNPSVIAQEILVEQTIYGDSADAGLTAAQQAQANLRGKVFRHFDGAGIVVTDLYDFKGNSLRSSRQFASDYKNPPDWSQNPALEAETFSSATAYDALNRAIASTAPDGSVYRPTFSDRGSPGEGGRQSARRAGQWPAGLDAVRHEYRLRRQGPAHADPIRQRRRDGLRATTPRHSGSRISRPRGRSA